MTTRSQLARLAARSIATVGVVLLALWVGAPPAVQSAGTVNASGSTLARNVVVPLTLVNRFFPEVTQEASTRQNSTATGDPTATRSVVYAAEDGAKKVTISVDQYRTPRGARSAYRQAVRNSKVPGFNPVRVPNVGQQTFAGTVTIGGETHIGLGTLDGKLIVGATLAGYNATPDHTAKLVALARAENAAAKAALAHANPP